MRKPSEIIKLAIEDPRYNPEKPGSAGVSWAFLCNLLDIMRVRDEITMYECDAAQLCIRRALEGHHSVANLLLSRGGDFKPKREDFMQFWDNLITKLQLHDR